MDRQAYLKEIESIVARGPYHADWESLCAFEVPAWYREAKFGIFIHWGVYSVPAFGDEWYPRKMYMQGSEAFEHHVKTYGPHKEFGYKDFIPLFTADRFDADHWMRVIHNAGAKFVVPVAEHHDGFQMYQSELSHWNAAEMGPKRDVLGELKTAAENRGLILGASSHRIEHWFFLGFGREFDSDIKGQFALGDFYWPSMPEREHMDLFSEPAPSEEFMQDWLLRCCEIVDRYRPSLMYFDWWIQHSALKPYLKQFAAYYYNRAAEWGTQVAITYKHDAFMFGSAIPDVERGQYSQVRHFYWQSDTAVCKNSWCDTRENDYKSAQALLCDLCDIVAKNGTLLLNIGPKADGTIGMENESILRDIGAWMKINGEAVYGTKPWRVAQEGPTVVEEGHFTDKKDKVFTAEDIRFTMKGSTLYAIFLRYPGNEFVYIRSLAENIAQKSPLFNGIIRDISVLGFDEKPVWSRTPEGLTLKTRNVVSDCPVVFKIELD